MVYKNLLNNIWSQLYDPTTEVSEIVEKFFHQDYEQCINGVIMNRCEYVQHVIAQKKGMTINEIDYKHVLENENELFAIYYPRGKNSNHQPIEAEVICHIRFEKQQIIRIHGQVRLIKGDLADVDMTNC